MSRFFFLFCFNQTKRSCERPPGNRYVRRSGAACDPAKSRRTPRRVVRLCPETIYCNVRDLTTPRALHTVVWARGRDFLKRLRTLRFFFFFFNSQVTRSAYRCETAGDEAGRPAVVCSRTRFPSVPPSSALGHVSRPSLSAGRATTGPFRLDARKARQRNVVRS